MSAPAESQQGAPADTILGTVVSSDSVPIPGAQIRVGLDDGKEYSALTDSLGRYFLVVSRRPRYYVAVRAFGFVPLSSVVLGPSVPGIVQRDVRLNALAIPLPTVRVAARQPAQRDSPGDRSTFWDSNLSVDLPVEQGDIQSIAALEEGVVRTGPNGAGISVNGQPPDQNSSTVDGVASSGWALPSEAVRSIGVITNTYDVSRGQFSGGQFVTTTLGGTNKWGGAIGVSADHPRFRFGPSRESIPNRESRFGLNGGGGGPLLRDKLFVYGALDLSLARSRAAPGLFDTESMREGRLSPDSVKRFQEILGSLGLSPQTGKPQATEHDLASFLAKIEYAVSATHSVAARIDGARTRRVGFGAPATLGDARSPASITASQGLLIQATSSRGAWSNEVRAYKSTASRGSDPSPGFPVGSLRGSALLDDPTYGDFEVSFGGLPPPGKYSSAFFELADDITHATGDGTHRFRAGFVGRWQRALSDGGGNVFGRFVFNSLDALERGRPASFARNLNVGQRKVATGYSGFYIGDNWRPKDGLGIAYGIRADRDQYSASGAMLAATGSSDREETSIPDGVVVLPRVGFRFEREGRHRLGLQGGVGGFAGVTNLESLLFGGMEEDGLDHLTCVAGAAPTPDWQSYLTNPSAIPTACDGEPSVFPAYTGMKTVFNPGFSTPRTWKASLAASGRFTPRWGMHVEARTIYGSHSRTAADLNLVSAPRFALGAEADRPVYVAPTDIDPGTGSIDLAKSRIDASGGLLREVASEGTSWTHQATASFTGSTPSIGLLSISYTLTNSKRWESAGFGSGIPQGTTAGDPRQFEWQEASFAPRHLVQVLSSKRITDAFRVTAVGRLTSGLAFTPTVRGDINGDGLHNDRAFIFAPGGLGTAQVLADMARLKKESSEGIRSCLERQPSEIAGAKSCRTGWVPFLDIRATLHTSGDVRVPRVTLMLTASNVASGLDYLLHGRENLRNWGQYAVPDPTLLEVRGFDPAAREFSYRVNTRFGQPIAQLPRSPFRLILQARVSFGADPRSQALVAHVDALLGSSSEKIRASLTRHVRNIPAIIIYLAASDTAHLNLTLAQRVRLQAAADSLSPKIAETVDKLAGSLWVRGPMTALRRAQIEQAASEATELVLAGQQLSRAVLTSEQWARIPAWLAKPLDEHELLQSDLEVYEPSGSN